MNIVGPVVNSIIQAVAEKWTIIKQQLIQTLYLQNYKNIILKYTTKLITF